jgi:hypothetical protein
MDALMDASMTRCIGCVGTDYQKILTSTDEVILVNFQLAIFIMDLNECRYTYDPVHCSQLHGKILKL